jgi:hypothetical protein
MHNTTSVHRLNLFQIRNDLAVQKPTWNSSQNQNFLSINVFEPNESPMILTYLIQILVGKKIVRQGKTLSVTGSAIIIHITSLNEDVKL